MKIEYKPMTLAEADNNSSNPTRDKLNCQSCVVVYEARRRGINIEALKFEYGCKADDLGDNIGLAFLNSKGENPTAIECKGSREELIAKIKEVTQNTGRYHIGNNRGNEGHIIVAERFKNGKLVLYDPQKNETYSIEDFVGESESIDYIKVDKLLFDKETLYAISQTVSIGNRKK